MTTATSSPYTYLLNNSNSNNSGIFTNITPGSYTVMVTDANGCTATSTVAVGHQFSATLTANPPCVNSTTPSTLSAPTYSFPVTYTVQTSSGATLYTGPANTYTVFTPGTYQVVVADAAGCSAAASVQVAQAANLSCAFSSCISPGKFTLTVNTSGTAGPYLYQLNTGAQQTSNVFPNVTPGSYTVYVSSANGCVAEQVVQTPQVLTSCCNDSIWAAAMAGSTYFLNSNVNALFTVFGVGPITTPLPILIDGTLTINQSLTFKDCPNIFFGPEAQIILTDSTTLSIENSVLRASCKLMWKGILATNNTQAVYIKKSSLIRDMRLGVEIRGVTLGNAPLLECSGTIFEDNLYSIVFENTPAPYAGYVQGCRFESTPWMLGPVNKMKRAISIYNCQDLEIGGLQFGYPGNGNRFKNVDNGIYISAYRAANSFVLESGIRLYNNIFENVTGGLEVNEEQNIMNNLYTNEKGSAIYAKNFSPKFVKAKLSLAIDYNTGTTNPHFTQCTKAVVTYNTNTSIEHARVVDCGAGFLNGMMEGRKYKIANNRLSNVIKGMEFVGNNTYGSYVRDNTITLPATLPPAIGSTGNFYTPVGISLKRLTPFYTANFDILNNVVTIPCEGGIGIDLMNTGFLVRVTDNQVLHTCMNTSGVPFTDVPYFNGIRIVNAYKTSIKLNTIVGNNTTLNYYGDNAAIRMHKSPGLHVYCNEMKDTKNGFYVVGDCSTGPMEVSGNHFNGHKYGMYFTYMGQEGSLGNPIGLQATATQSGFDPNNTFAGNNYTGGYRLYKNSMCGGASNEKYHTSFSNLQPNQSGGATCKYNIWPNGIPSFSFNCEIISPSILGEHPINHLEEIARQNINYSNNAVIANWIDQLELNEILNMFPDLKSASNILNTYSQNNSSTVYGTISNCSSRLRNLLAQTSIEDMITFDSKLGECENHITTLNCSNDPEKYEKLMNAVYLFVIKYGVEQLNADQTTLVEWLAMSCPFENGTAVYKARMIYDLINPSVQYNDEHSCDQGNQNRLQNPEQHQVDEKQLANIYPNPVTDELTIAHTASINDYLLFTLYNVFGEEKGRWKLNTEFNHCNVLLNDLANGLYFYKLIKNNSEIQTGKLIKN